MVAIPSVLFAVLAQAVVPVEAPPPTPPPQVTAQQPPAYKEGPRFGLFLGGVVVPDTINAAAGGALVTFGSRRMGPEARLYVVVYRTKDDYTTTTGAVLVAHETMWWGHYGLGAGGGFGYADFSRVKSTGGWNDSSYQAVVYAAPVMLRFGRQPTVELGVNLGATRFFTHDVRPFGYLYAGLLF